LIGRVTHVGTTSIIIKVEVYLEQMYSDDREKAMEGTFTMVSIDEHKKPVKIVY
jgi:acyl-CoA hydrolase